MKFCLTILIICLFTIAMDRSAMAKPNKYLIQSEDDEIEKENNDLVLDEKSNLSALRSKYGGPSFDPNKRAKCIFKGDGTKGIHGEVTISQYLRHTVPVTVFNGVIVGKIKAGLHGFHVHTDGDLGDNCKAAGGHFNPEDVNHGGKSFLVRHVGDLGNVEANQTGHIRIDFSDNRALLSGPNDIWLRAIVVHEGTDDLGLLPDKGSQTTGNAGPRAGCCTIEHLN